MVHHVWYTMYLSHIFIFGKAVRVERGQAGQNRTHKCCQMNVARLEAPFA